MTAKIRPPIEDERTQVIDVLRTSLNFPRSWAEERGATTPLVDHRCAYVDGRIVATAAGYRFRQWFGGRDLMMSGVYAVATLPEHRGAGLGSEVVLGVLRDARDEGASVSALYPAVLRPYRKGAAMADPVRREGSGLVIPTQAGEVKVDFQSAGNFAVVQAKRRTWRLKTDQARPKR